eukprot:scaffold34_cov260-Pinguiococcus_pyrenoidosus.AAC.49
MPGSCSPHWELNEHPEEAIPEAHCGPAKVLSHQVAIGRPRGRHPSSRRQRVSGCLRWWPRRNRDTDHQESFRERGMCACQGKRSPASGSSLLRTRTAKGTGCGRTGGPLP